ncbi:MAG: nucleotide exchange factor GrpE [Candidatus Aminicenantes bacterium]|nr:nucleotide exchange factor GrpE [Candidatus Aminicenantes bacterium]
MPKKIKTDEDVKKEKESAEKIEIEYLTEQKKTPKKRRTPAKAPATKKYDAEIKSLKEEIQNLKQDYLRQIADKDNLRKRLEKDKSEYYQYALSEFFGELLVVLDNFERSLKSDDQKNLEIFQEGVEMIYKQLLDLLNKYGVKSIEIKDKTFNPHLHQAFMTEESEDIEEPQISEEFQRGYTLNERLLRPSLVKVVLPKKENET